MRLPANAALRAAVVLVAIAWAAAGHADIVAFTALLGAEGAVAPSREGPTGKVALSVDTATKTVRWTVEYSGLASAPQSVGCGALDSPGGPAIWVNSNLSSPITGSKVLSDAEIAALARGRWVCVVSAAGDEAELGGIVKPAR